eukprot:TRINITY_DN9052_c0_g1_i3.p1 TRINITY_DN9052_c0_g1~~TRINITY_DN9052_c0_g1_i3.p1  ORF type:complete len:139 (+),score=23.79 TRINITY_DN9052_c0_g1_i3:75-491(+)
MLCVFYHILYRCLVFFFFLMIRRPPRSTQGVSSAASDVYKRQSKHCTFSPQINKGKTYSGVQSRLQLANNLDTYIDRIQIQQYQKEQQALVKRQTREIGELIECTHKPQFSQIPYYMKVKQEAEAISAMKSRSISHEV